MGSIEKREGKGTTSWRVSWDLPKAMRGQGLGSKGQITVDSRAEAERINVYVKNAKHAVTTAQAESWYLGDTSSSPVVTEAVETSTTIKDWVGRFLRIKAKGRAQSNTVDAYESQLTVFMADVAEQHGEDCHMDQLTGEDIMNFFDRLKVRPGRGKNDTIANSTIDHYYAVLSHFWNVAIDNEVARKNPVLKSGWAKGERDDNYEGEDDKADEYFEPEQYARLLELIRPDFTLFVRFLGETGVRFSEATALRVYDLNFDIMKAHIRRAWKKKYSGGRLTPGDTKGRQRRWIEVTSDLMLLLKIHVKGKKPEDYVFTSPTGQVISHSNFRNRQWVPAMIKAQQCSRHLPTRTDGRNGLEVYDPKSPSFCSCLGDQNWTRFTPHSLRHTFATWCILDPSNSITLLSIQLGHKDTRTTENIYIHVRTKRAGLGLGASIGRTLNHHLNVEPANMRHPVAV